MADVAAADAAMKGAAATAAMAGGKRSRWLAHVKKTMKAHKGKSLKAVLKLAKKTYKGGASSLSPATVGGRRTRRGTRRA
jgi:hypothetical protein